MSTVSTPPPHVTARLLAVIDEHRPVIPARHRDTVRAICIESVGLGLELGRGTRERADRARSSAELLLDLSCPQVNPAARDALAQACWRAAAATPR